MTRSRKYYVSRRSAVTTVALKVVNTSTFEVMDFTTTLDGAFADNKSAMDAVMKSWEDETTKPVAVTGLSCKVVTYGMTAANWFANAEVLDSEEVTLEEAAAFGKRSKKSDADAQ